MMMMMMMMMGLGSKGITCVNCGERFIRGSRDVGQYCSEDCRPLVDDDDIEEVSE